MSRVPRIRFKGFEEDWEQRKVGELLIERNEQSPMSIEYPLMAFIANEGVEPKGERYDRSSLVTDTENKLYKRTEFGDFIYSSNNLETGSIGLNKYGKACISPVYSIFQPTGIADSDFLGRRLVRKDFINAMVKWRQGVIYGQWRIHESDFLKIEISVPSVKEQRKIGAYLDDLDRLITLHQRKLEKLKIIKKSMLENLFPQNGEKTPKIRFSGFTEDWEQRKLGEMYTQLVERNIELLPFEKILSASTMNYKVDGSGAAEESLSNYKRLRVGDIAFEGHTSRDFRYGRFVLNDTGDGILSPRFSALRPIRCMPIKFWKYYIHYEPIMKKILVNSTKSGTMMNELVVEEFLKEVLLVPEEYEQQKIGVFFNGLDRLITLHQSKLEKLQKIKKSMLESMFV